MSTHEQALAAQIQQNFKDQDALIAEIGLLRQCILDLATQFSAAQGDTIQIVPTSWFQSPTVQGVIAHDDAVKRFNAK